jgi:metallophosphoesterase superfamily enzyme
MPQPKKKGYSIRKAFDQNKEYSDFSDREGAMRRGPAFLDAPLNKTPRDVSPAMHNWHKGAHWNDSKNRGSFGRGTKDKMPGVDNNKPKGYKMRGLT